MDFIEEIFFEGTFDDAVTSYIEAGVSLDNRGNSQNLQPPSLVEDITAFEASVLLGDTEDRSKSAFTRKREAGVLEPKGVDGENQPPKRRKKKAPGTTTSFTERKEQRKEKKNEREKVRRVDANLLFDDLSELLEMKQTKRDKCTVMCAAVNTIIALREMQEANLVR